MKYKQVLTSTSYSIAQLALGLLLHPYQSMQSIVQEKVFVGMTLFPTATLAGVTVLWRFLIVPVVRIFFSCQSSSFFVCQMLPFFSDWLTFFCIYWQILLLYLFFRFWNVFQIDRK
jgi:hypothetical protein